MGRSKMKMEFIPNVKTRRATFKKMKESLIKKAYELHTLCDVDVSIVTFPPNTDNNEQLHPQPYQIWPPGSDKLLSHIEEFKKQLLPAEDKTKRTVEVDSNYLEERCKKLEDAIIEQRKKNYDVVYPSWNPCYNDLPEEQLVQIASDLEYKLQQSTNARLGKYESQPDYHHHQSEFALNQQYITSDLVNNADNQYMFDDDNLTFDYKALVGGGDDGFGTTDVNNMMQYYGCEYNELQTGYYSEMKQNNALMQYQWPINPMESASGSMMQYQCPVNPMDTTTTTGSMMQYQSPMDTTTTTGSMMQYQSPMDTTTTTGSMMQYQSPMDTTTTTGSMMQYQSPMDTTRTTGSMMQYQSPMDTTTTGSMMQYQYPTTTIPSLSSSIFNTGYSGSCNEAQLLHHPLPQNQMSVSGNQQYYFG